MGIGRRKPVFFCTQQEPSPHGDGSFFGTSPLKRTSVDFRHITMYGLLALSKW